jgi:glycosyltransferase involved in cell wall biosynthesis
MLKKKYLPLISIVMPTYNHAVYLGKALQSILDQTYKNWEAIVIDNHSTDGTNKVISRYVDPRIKYLKIHNTGVIAKSRNKGILAAKGEWIAFLDSDDWWSPDKLKTCIDFFNNNVDFIYHDLEILSIKQSICRKKVIKTRQLKKPILLDLLLSGNIISNSSVVVRKKILKKIGFIDESKELVTAEDYNTWLKISTVTDQFLYLPKKLGYYFIHDQNISKKNMSLLYRRATNNFLSVLNNKQKIKMDTNIKYLSGRFNYLSLNYKKAKKDLLFVLKYGSFKLKIKSLIIIFCILISLNW